jgi:hypothetical protein
MDNKNCWFVDTQQYNGRIYLWYCSDAFTNPVESLESYYYDKGNSPPLIQRLLKRLNSREFFRSHHNDQLRIRICILVVESVAICISRPFNLLNLIWSVPLFPIADLVILIYYLKVNLRTLFQTPPLIYLAFIPFSWNGSNKWTKTQNQRTYECRGQLLFERRDPSATPVP